MKSLSLPGAVLLSLLLTAQTMAATWSLPEPLALGSGYAGGLVTIGTATAVAAYSNGGAVVVRRSGDAGETWSSPVQLSSTSGTDPAIAGRGRHVDVAWLEDGRVRYTRSGDGGVTFGPSVALSPVSACGDCVLSVTVARGPDGLVAVAWSEEVGDIRSFIRVSKDGGVSFRAPKSLGWVIWPKVAVGRGVVYVEYRDEFHCCFFPLLLRRSLDAGASWSAPRLIAKSVPLRNDTSITAAGDEAYVAWSGPGIRYRRTTNKGATWSTRLGLTSPLGDKVFPVISLRGGVVRAVFTNWQMSGVFYRKSTNGTSWSHTEVVSDSGFPLGVGLAGHTLALYRDDQGIYIRGRTH